jgi:bla regulator protein blaR1
MVARLAHKANFSRKFLLGAVCSVAVAVPVVFGLANAPPKIRSEARQASSAQAPAPDWQTAAGGKMAFDVASVKQNSSSDPPRANFPLGPGDSYSPNGGLFSATNSQLSVFIGFAYKLTPGQSQSLQSQLPKWAIANRFDIQARAPANTTKDQMRLMMQSLLVDRFKLGVHTETRRLPVFVLVLVKPGQPGPQLVPHSPDSPPCTPFTSTGTGPAPAATLANGFPAACGVFLTNLETGRIHTSARNVTMSLIASSLTAFPFKVDRPVSDGSGLSGVFDLSIEFVPDAPIKLNGETALPDESGTTFLEALKDQLGLKLESQTGPVDVIVVDHVEEPSPN